MNKTFKHSFKDTLRENMSLAVYNTGYEKCRSGYTWGPAIRDHYLIHYVISGKGTLYSNGISYPVERGDLFFIRPSSIVSYSADRDDPWEYCWVGFNGTEADRLVGMTAFSKGPPVAHYTNHDHLKRLLLNIYNFHGKNPSNEMRMIGFLYLFLSELVSNNEVRVKQYSSEHSYLEKAMRYIQRNFCEMISVDDIAEFVGISRSHLYRIFMKNTGMSPNEYLSSYRINKACGMLRDSNLKINEIASSVGIQDQLYFSRVFKKHKGISPSRYLKQFQSEQSETSTD